MKIKLILGLLIVWFTFSILSCKKKGCTNSQASNYNSEAEKDDGSCDFEITHQNISYGVDDIQTMELYLPAQHDENTKVVIMVHGGGWIVGYNETDKVTTFDGRYGWDILNPLLEEGFACAVMKYRTACYKENPSNATFNSTLALDLMMQDIDLAIQKLKNESTNLGISNKHFQLIGESAGGHIVMSYAIRSASDPTLKSVVSMFGPTDLDDFEWKNNLRVIDSTVPQGVLVDGNNYFRTADNFCNLETNKKLHLLAELRSFGDSDTVKVYDINPYLQAISTTTLSNINNNTPIFIQHGANDDLVPVSQADLMFNAVTSVYGNSNCLTSDFNCQYKQKTYDNCGHGWIGAACQKNLIMNDIKKWIKAH